MAWALQPRLTYRSRVLISEVPAMRRLTLAVIVLVVSVACATNPVSGKKELSLMSEAEELAIGQQADAEIRREMGVYDNQELQRYVSDIGMRLARQSHRPNLPWTFTVVDSPAVNAFAAARRLRLHHARHPAVSRRRGGTGWCARPRNRPRHRAPCVAAVTRVRRPAASDSRCSASSSRRPLRSGSRRRRGSACSSSSTAGTTSSSPTGWA